MQFGHRCERNPNDVVSNSNVYTNLKSNLFIAQKVHDREKGKRKTKMRKVAIPVG